MAKLSGDAAIADPFRAPTRVGTYSAVDTGTRLSWFPLKTLTVFISTLFAAIHCTAWSLSFPSETEHILWRVCSLILLAVPQVFLLNIVLQYLDGLGYISRALKRVLGTHVKWLIISLFGIGVPLYVMARLILIFEAFFTLRTLPPAALAELEWTSFIPHI